MYKLDLPVDYKEAAAIERRRNQEEQRKSRIFNAKTRIIGIDVECLDQQKKDKQQQEEYEKRRTEAFVNYKAELEQVIPPPTAADMTRNDKIAMLIDQRQEEDRRQLNKALNEFRQLHQQPNSRREFDLYDPDAAKKDKPARVCDDDPRCGVSSLQKFDGEDLNNKARHVYQNEQMLKWAKAQMREKEQARLNQAEADRLYDLKMKELELRAMDLQEAERQCRSAINVAQKDYNAALAREQAEKRRLKAAQEQDDNATEIANHIYGDILTENPAVAISAFGPHRIVPDRWKGMSPQQLEDIRRTQDNQIREKMRLKQEDDLRNLEYDRQRIANAKAAIIIERQQNRTIQELSRRLADENRRLANQQKQHQDFLDKEVYTNPPTASYFMQFNTTTR